jgi:hypothetical protein
VILSKLLPFLSAICKMKCLGKGPSSTRPEFGFNSTFIEHLLCAGHSHPEDLSDPWRHRPFSTEQPSLSSRKTWNQHIKSHFRLYVQLRHAACLGFLIHQYFPQDDKCAANKRRQLPTLSETGPFSWGCGRAWLVDVSQETGGRSHAGRLQEGT